MNVNEAVKLSPEAALKYLAFKNQVLALGELGDESVARPSSGELVLWIRVRGFATVAMIVPPGAWAEAIGQG